MRYFFVLKLLGILGHKLSKTPRHAELTYAVTETESKFTATAFASEVISASIPSANTGKILKQVQDDKTCLIFV